MEGILYIVIANVFLFRLFDIFWTTELSVMKLVHWCINMSQSVMHKDCFAIFKVKAAVNAH